MSRMGQRKTLNCGTVSTEASVYIKGALELVGCSEMPQIELKGPGIVTLNIYQMLHVDYLCKGNNIG